MPEMTCIYLLNGSQATNTFVSRMYSMTPFYFLFTRNLLHN
jgi:hypothetical protein